MHPASDSRTERRLKGQPRLDWGIRAHSRPFAFIRGFNRLFHSWLSSDR